MSRSFHFPRDAKNGRHDQGEAAAAAAEAAEAEAAEAEAAEAEAEEEQEAEEVAPLSKSVKLATLSRADRFQTRRHQLKRALNPNKSSPPLVQSGGKA